MKVPGISSHFVYLPVLIILCLPGRVIAQDADTTFFVVGKAARFFQNRDKQFKLWRYHVFANLVDTNRVGKIEGLATYTNQTYVDFYTTGQARHTCPE